MGCRATPCARVCGLCGLEEDPQAMEGLGNLQATQHALLHGQPLLFHPACALYPIVQYERPTLISGVEGPLLGDQLTLEKKVMEWYRWCKNKGKTRKCKWCNKGGSVLKCAFPKCLACYHYPCARMAALHSQLVFIPESLDAFCVHHNPCPKPPLYLERTCLGMWQEGQGGWHGGLQQEASTQWLPQAEERLMAMQQQWGTRAAGRNQLPPQPASAANALSLVKGMSASASFNPAVLDPASLTLLRSFQQRKVAAGAAQEPQWYFKGPLTLPALPPSSPAPALAPAAPAKTGVARIRLPSKAAHLKMMPAGKTMATGHVLPGHAPVQGGDMDVGKHVGPADSAEQHRGGPGGFALQNAHSSLADHPSSHPTTTITTATHNNLPTDAMQQPAYFLKPSAEKAAQHLQHATMLIRTGMSPRKRCQSEEGGEEALAVRQRRCSTPPIHPAPTFSTAVLDASSLFTQGLATAGHLTPLTRHQQSHFQSIPEREQGQDVCQGNGCDAALA